jgi:hypothetical protein
MSITQPNCSVLVCLHCWCCGLNTPQPTHRSRHSLASPSIICARDHSLRHSAIERCCVINQSRKFRHQRNACDGINGIPSNRHNACVFLGNVPQSCVLNWQTIALRKRKDYKHDGVPPVKAKYGRKGCAGRTMSQSPYLILDYQAFMI